MQYPSDTIESDAVCYAPLGASVGKGAAVKPEAKRQALVHSLKVITPQMRRFLSNQKSLGKAELERPDFVWHILLQSFATWGTDPEAMAGEAALALDARYGIEADYDSMERLCEEHGLTFPTEE